VGLAGSAGLEITPWPVYIRNMDAGAVMVDGLEEPLKMVLSKKVGLAEANIVITSTATLSVSHKGYGDIRWLSLVEKN